MTERAVVGVGNPLMGDDGVAEHVVGVLQERGVPPETTVSHTGTTAFLALEVLDGTEKSVVVDAVSADDAEPGTVHRFRYRNGAFEGEVPDVLMHDFGFADALYAGREAYDLPDAIDVVGVEPEDTSMGPGLSDAVEAAVPDVVEAVRTALDVSASDEATNEPAVTEQ